MEKRSEVHLKCKEVIYGAHFLPIVTYAVETWTLNVSKASKVEAMGMKFVRSMLTVVRRNKIRNSGPKWGFREYIGFKAEMVWACNENGKRENAKENVGNEVCRIKTASKTAVWYSDITFECALRTELEECSLSERIL
ncbi:unnamed protein product [Timema podura]|uniref:Uncharacterized protein n=1 Tax=Timema podura TaxID=61482 RepID=A0ABN7PQB1_TIMPD|nr:unnamed protein product [Timema podura]